MNMFALILKKDKNMAFRVLGNVKNVYMYIGFNLIFFKIFVQNLKANTVFSQKSIWHHQIKQSSRVFSMCIKSVS